MITSSYSIAGGDFETAGTASRLLKEQLKRLGVEGEIMRRIMIAAYEAEMNVAIHAFKGNLWVRLNHGRIDLEVIDEGPGIPDLELAMKPGFSTAPPEARALGFGAGMGLPNISKASDVFEIDSTAGKGTRIRSTIYLKGTKGAETPGNSLAVAADLCSGCLDCIKACPTRALRVWKDQPRILDTLCVDCTACIAACKNAVFTIRVSEAQQERLSEPVEARHDTLIIPQAFLTQFGLKVPPRWVLSALRCLGFNDVRFSEEWEEELRRKVRQQATESRAAPIVSPFCPVVANLIESQFPALIGQLAPFLSPVEAALQAHGLQSATFVAACPSQYTLLSQASVSGRLRVLTPARLNSLLLPLLAGRSPVSSRDPGAGARSLRSAGQEQDVLSAWGLAGVIGILEQAEKGLLQDFRVLELYACVRGCFGSPLFQADPFVARSRWLGSGLGRRRKVGVGARRQPRVPRVGLRLDQDMGRAIALLARIDEITRSLPGRDCGACGAPTCSTLAEDIVLGRSELSACKFLTGSEQT